MRQLALLCALLSTAALAKTPDVARNALEFGVKADGVTNDAAAMQNAISYAISAGVELLLPAGFINLGTTSLILNSPFNGSISNASIVTMTGNDGRDGSIGATTFIYSGANSAMRIINGTTCTNAQTCAPQPCDGVNGMFSFNGHLRQFTIQQANGGPNMNTNPYTAALEIHCAQEFYVEDVDIFPASLGQIGMTNGIVCDNCATAVTFNRITIGPRIVTTGPLAFQNTITNGFNITSTVGSTFGNSGILVNDIILGGENAFRIESGTAIWLRNIWMEATDNILSIDDSQNTNGSSVQDFQISQMHGLFTNFQPNFAVVRMENLNNRAFSQYEISIRDSDFTIAGGLALSHVIPAAQCTRSGGNTVTCTCSAGTSCPSSTPATGGVDGRPCTTGICFFIKPGLLLGAGNGSYVYKTSAAADAQCPNGLKQLQTVTASTFTYTEMGANGACGQVSTFVSAPHAIQYITNAASQANQSQVDVQVENSRFDGWQYGTFLAASTNTQTASTANWVSYRQSNTAGVNVTNAARYTRNFNPWGHNLAVNTETPSGANAPQEVWISNSPASPAINFSISTQYRPMCQHITLAAGAATFSTFDSQHYCTCNDNTGAAGTLCKAVVTAGPFLGYRAGTTGTVTVTGTTTDTVDVCCY